MSHQDECQGALAIEKVQSILTLYNSLQLSLTTLCIFQYGCCNQWHILAVNNLLQKGTNCKEGASI